VQHVSIHSSWWTYLCVRHHTAKARLFPQYGDCNFRIDRITPLSPIYMTHMM